LIVPAPTNSAKIDELIVSTSTLNERIAAIRGDLGDLKKTGDDIRSQFHQLETQVARTDEALKHLKERLDRSDSNDRLARIEEALKSTTKELDKLRSNRFEIGKVFLAAFFSFIGAGIFFLLNVLYQWLDKLKR
jgi:septal ring factor EnvC (AmiA/AmiB activator)